MVHLFSNKSQMMSKCGKNQEKWHTYGNKEFICFISFKKQNVVDGDIYCMSVLQQIIHVGKHKSKCQYNSTYHITSDENIVKMM